MNFRLISYAAIAAAALSSAFAQEPIKPVETFTATRSLDVVVSDARGGRVKGLAQSDFSILQDGKAQVVTRFAEVAHNGAAADDDAGRKIIIAFDTSSLTMAGRKKSLDTARLFLKNRVRPSDRVMVAEISNVGAAMAVGSWTSDPAEIEKSLASVESRSLVEKSFERSNAEQSIQMAVDFDKQTSGNSAVSFDTLMQTARQYATQKQAEALRSSAAIQEVVSIFNEGAGKKVVVLAGGGLSTRPGSELFTFLDTIKQQAEMGLTGPGVARSAKNSNPRAEISRYDIAKDLREVAKMARNKGIVIYPLQHDASGTTMLAAERKSASDTNADFAGVADQMSGYQMLAAETGGLALIGGSSEEAVAQIASDFDSHYVLTFQQTISGTGPLPRVDVKVAKAGHRVRSSFLGGPQNKDAEIQEVVVANHKGEPPSNDLKIALASDPPVAEGTDQRVKLRVLIPAKSLTFVPAGPEVVVSFAVYISTGDARGNSGTVNRQTKELRFPAEALPQIQDKTIGFAVEIVVPAGRTQISVGVMDQKSEQTGFAKMTI